MIIAIEEIDQAGKQTQAIMLANKLQQNGMAVKVFEFPDYNTPIGRKISVVLNHDDCNV